MPLFCLESKNESTYTECGDKQRSHKLEEQSLLTQSFL